MFVVCLKGGQGKQNIKMIPSCFSLLIVSSMMTVQISIKPFYGENGSMFGVGEVMVMLVIRTHLAGDTSRERSNCQ